MDVSSSSSTAHVLYMDDQNHLVPLLNCYHSTASRSLCSRISTTTSLPQRYPITTLSYVDSYYCSSCFQYYDTIQGISKPLYGACSKCLLCPFCFTDVTLNCVPKTAVESINGMTTQTFDCYYKCHNCDYTSKQYCIPQLMVQLSLIISSEKSIIEIESVTSSPTTFTKWESLQSAAKDLLNTVIRQQYYTSALFTSDRVQQYTSLFDQWKAYYEVQQQRQRNTSHIATRTMVPTSHSRSQQPDNNKGKSTVKWSMSELEDKLRSIHDGKKQLLLPSGTVDKDPNYDHDPQHKNGGNVRRKSIHDILLQQNENPISADIDMTNEIQRQYQEWENVSMLSYLMQSVLFDNHRMIDNSGASDSGALDIELNKSNYIISYYPIPRSFNVRYSYRSKKDVLIYHRPGIVLKPKLNPLDGDSSTSHTSAMIGQWYRKDSSAIYTIPQVQVVKERYDDSAKTNGQKKHYFLLQVSNPTLGPIRVRLLLNQSTSSFELKYKDEFSHWNDEGIDVDETIATATFRNVLLDPLRRVLTDEIHIDLSISQSTASENSTPTIELQSMEDSILLDYPGTATATNIISTNRESNERNAIPDVVKLWGLDKTDNSSKNNSLRFVAQNSSTAWYELSVINSVIRRPSPVDATSENTPSSTASSYGIPMVLEIDIGNGSWESSLIPVDKENDAVRLDLTVVFPLRE
jgi:hypothetical protein